MAYPPEPQDTCCISLFEKFSNCYLIRWSKERSQLELVFDHNKEWIEVRNTIFDIVVLLEYLESNRYIGVFSMDLLKDNQIFNSNKYELQEQENGLILIWAKDKVQLDIKSTSLNGTYERKILLATQMLKENTSIGEHIMKYANSSYHTTQNLRDFVDNGFKTREDLRYEKTHKQTWIAIGVSILVGLFSISKTNWIFELFNKVTTWLTNCLPR